MNTRNQLILTHSAIPMALIIFIGSFVTEMLSLRLAQVLLRKRMPEMWEVNAGTIIACALTAFVVTAAIVWMPGQ